MCSRSSLASNTNSTLTKGGPSLNSSSTLVSPNDHFTLAFSRPGDWEPTDSSYLGIRYNDFTEFCWTANHHFPISDGS
ncbi:unnamed protein product [Linum tenue]|uniref:Uncharacterized protein n=1 Tax=Linum tenue TaxID=586396 RepID=A0AAV0L4D9_9ROSI|nr:unnamed protein product [Linum tenue]